MNTDISSEIRRKLCEKIRTPEEHYSVSKECKVSRGLDKKADESLICPV